MQFSDFLGGGEGCNCKKYPIIFVCFLSLGKNVRSEVEEEDDTIHMGNAIMTFYAALIDLLGRCAPEMHVGLLLLLKEYLCSLDK